MSNINLPKKNVIIANDLEKWEFDVIKYVINLKRDCIVTYEIKPETKESKIVCRNHSRNIWRLIIHNIKKYKSIMNIIENDYSGKIVNRG